MKLKIKLILLGFIVLTKFCLGQDYHTDFQKSFENNDTIKQFEILQKWEETNPKDAELFTSYFNYYFNKSRDEILVVAAGKPPKGEKYLSLTDSSGNYAGFIGSQINYDDSFLKKGLDKISDGIKLYPNRLDMRFGKIYVLGQIKDWQSFTKEIIKTIDYSAKNENQWTWTNNEKQKDGKEFFLGSLQDYQIQLYNTGDDDLIPYMQEIGKAILKYYPNHIESLSNVAVGYLITKDYDSALEYLLKAEKVNPKDCVVLSNIAYAYKEKNDNEDAIKYYNKVIEYGDDQSKTFAKEEIERLKK